MVRKIYELEFLYASFILPLRCICASCSILYFSKEAVLRWFYASQYILFFSKELLLRFFYSYLFFMILQRSVVPLLYAYHFISCSVSVFLISLFYAYISKHFHITLILPHRIIFSTELLKYIILEIIIIFYSKFMMIMES